METSESNTGSETASCIVEGQSVLGRLDDIVPSVVVVVATLFLASFRLIDRGFNDILDLVVDSEEEAAEEELK